jgi:hypothetical protein
VLRHLGTLGICPDIDTLQNSGRITLPEDTVKINSKFKIRNPKQYQISNIPNLKHLENCEEEIIILNLGNPGFENYRLGENGIEIIKEPSGGAQPGGSGSAPADATSFTPPNFVAPPGYMNWLLYSDPLGYAYAYDPNWYATHTLSSDLTGLITDEILWAFVSGGVVKSLQLETNILSGGNVFKIVSKKYGVGFRIDPAHHGKPWGHMKMWTWPPKYP